MFFIWTQEQINFLKLNYNKHSNKELSILLNKSLSSILSKASYLGIKKRDFWTQEEIEILKKLYPIKTNKQLEKIFHHPSESIGVKARGLNLKKSLGLKYHDLDEYIIQLQILSHQLNRTPLFTETQNKEWFIPSKTLFRYCGGYREVCKLAGLPININIFGSTHPAYVSKLGDLCWSKAEVIITNFFIDNKINYKREVLYSKYIIDDRCNTKNFDWVINNSICVEYFGMMDKEFYCKKANEKIKICKDHNVDLIELYENDLSNLLNIFKFMCSTNKIRND